MTNGQRTIKKPVEFEGTGVFGGEQSKLRFLPAEVNSGISFVRTDLPAQPLIKVLPTTIMDKIRSTAVSNGDNEVNCIEHLLSAIVGLGISNITIQVDSNEVPWGDGSSKPFVEILQNAGIVEQNEPRRTITVKEPIYVNEDGATIIALPNENGMLISFTIQYDNQVIGKQHLSFKLEEGDYVKDISPARSFCLKSEAESLTSQGLVKAGNFKNTLVVDTNEVIDNTLIFKDEFVRHKILDLLGDLACLGGPINAHIIAFKSGHAQNIKLAKRILNIHDETRMQRKTDTLVDIREIFNILPHRYPMLLIDKVIELDGYDRAVGIKNVTYNEPFFMGHFPNQPIMPGVLIIESMAQLAGALLMRKSGKMRKLPVLLSLDNVKLRKTVVPGDQLRIEAQTIKIKSRTGEVYGRALVEGQIAAEASMKFMLIEES